MHLRYELADLLKREGTNTLTLDGAQIDGLAGRYGISGRRGEEYCFALLVHGAEPLTDAHTLLSMFYRKGNLSLHADIYGIEQRASNAYKEIARAEIAPIDPDTDLLPLILELLRDPAFERAPQWSYLHAGPVLAEVPRRESLHRSPRNP